jgi:hypothetical protein
LDVTKSYTLWVSIAKIAFEYFPFNGVKAHGAEGTHCHTRPAADAFVIIHFDFVKLVIAGNRIGRTNAHARGILALLAGHGYIHPVHFPFHYSDTASGRVGNPVMFYRTYKFT